MNKKEQKFLGSKMNELVENDIISSDQYNNAMMFFNKQIKPGKSIVTIFTGIGIFLMALSMITLFAINWENIAKSGKVMISFLPIIGVAIMMFFYMKREDKKLGVYTAVFAPVAIIATNSLINQVFHMQTEVYEMFFTSLMMFLPIAFILRNYLSMLVYGVGTVIYSLSATGGWSAEWQALLSVFVLALPLIIFNVINYLKNRDDKKNVLMWTCNVVLITLLLFVKEIMNPQIIFIYSYLMYLLTRILFDEDNFLSKVFKVYFVGFMLIGCISSGLFEFVSEMELGFDALILAVLTGIAVYVSKTYKDIKEMALLVFIAMVQYTCLDEMTLFILTNLLVAAVGIYKVVIGNRLGDYKETKQGIAIILLLIAYRFLLSELDFATKSVLFLITGAAFLIGANKVKKGIGGDDDE